VPAAVLIIPIQKSIKMDVFSRLNRPEREANHSPSYSGEIRTECSLTSTHPYVFMEHRDRFILVGFEVLTAVSTKMAVFWVVAPCSLVEVYRRFRGPCCLHHRPDYGGSKDL
jgi:hypothetical protein